MTSRTLRSALVAVPTTLALVLGATTATAQVQPSATVQVSKTVITEGETITITNTDDDASRCEGGLVVIFVDGAPIAAGWNQLLVEPDIAGDWSTTWTAPIAAEWPSQSVGGPFTFNAFCTAPNPPAATPSAQPEFEYLPVVVTIAAAETTTTTTAPTVAAAAATTPAFTG